MKYQGLREIRKVTEYRNSEGVKSVFKTKHVGYAWVLIGTENYSPDENDEMFCSISTDLSTRLNHRTNRHVNDDMPDVSITTLELLLKGVR